MFYIFGGNGFVGRYLANELAGQNKETTVIDLHDSLDSRIDGKVSYIKADIRNLEEMRSILFSEADTVINLAANQYHTKVPKNRHEYFFNTNTVGTKNILTAMTEKGCKKLIQFTTDMTYGKPQYLPVDIKHPQNPFGPYGESKKACEEICRDFRNTSLLSGGGINICIFRPRMISGPGRLGILVKLFKLIDRNLPVPTIGNGRNHYQMISVFDCVSAIMAAIEKGVPNKEYNLGSAESPNITTLLKAVIKTARSHSFVIHTPGKLVKLVLKFLDNIGLTIMYPEQFMIADEEYILDISETQKDLGWNPKYNDEDMLIQAYKMYKEGNS